VVRDSAVRLGGLDVVVYATAIDPLVRLVDTDADRWHDVFATNVVGASLVTRAALAPLSDTHGRMVFISASSVGRPLPGMGAYETSKAALDEMVRAWRGEHPEIGFCNVAVGNTLGTEVYESWDRELLGELSAVWETRGYVHDNGPGAMTVDDCATAVLTAMTSPVDLRYVLALPAPGSTMDIS
jgi:NAD(P)-dependent dehydrogenase (short-subunit alcohol dehydrogenase family)